MDTPGSFWRWLKGRCKISHLMQENLAEYPDCFMFALGNLEAGSFRIYLKDTEQEQSQSIIVSRRTVRLNYSCSLKPPFFAELVYGLVGLTAFPGFTFINSVSIPSEKITFNK